MPAIEERVDNLEIALQNFIHSVGIEFNKAYNSNEEFKAEMKEFKDEMKEFKNISLQFISEMKDNVRDMNKKFGEMSRKLGTIVEDLVFPSMPRIILEKFGFDLEEFSINIKLKKYGLNQEYDAIGIYRDRIFLNSTKTTIRENDISQLKDQIKDLSHWFPAYKGKQVFGILAGFDISEKIIKLSEAQGFLVMGVGGDLMELVNSENFIPKGIFI